MEAKRNSTNVSIEDFWEVQKSLNKSWKTPPNKDWMRQVVKKSDELQKVWPSWKILNQFSDIYIEKIILNKGGGALKWNRQCWEWKRRNKI